MTYSSNTRILPKCNSIPGMNDVVQERPGLSILAFTSSDIGESLVEVGQLQPTANVVNPNGQTLFHTSLYLAHSRNPSTVS
jgi:hypothetical protein